MIELQPAKAPSPIVLRVAGRVSEVSEEQCARAVLQRVVRAAGRVSSVREVLSLSAPWLI